MKKRLFSLFLTLVLIASVFPASAGANDSSVTDTPSFAAPALPFELDCKSAILIDADSGRVLLAKNENEPLPPASVTKVMTLLICMEEIASGHLSLGDTVSASTEASKMGGSQIYLREGETMSVEDLIKSVVIASANDAAYALAEHISGSEDAFVARMNERARELGMKNTCFENTNGLDDTTVKHETSAYDIALMSRALLEHDLIKKYSTSMTDTVRNGEFTLTNTNRLIRFYKGATGLKTGSTSKAGFCISASAERDGLSLIAVVMGSPTRNIRNDCARKLLDYGFASYSRFESEGEKIQPITLLGGRTDKCNITADAFSALLAKGENEKVSFKVVIPESVFSPLVKGEKIGEVVYYVGDKEIGRAAIRVAENAERISFRDILGMLISGFMYVR